VEERVFNYSYLGLLKMSEKRELYVPEYKEFSVSAVFQ
jgi:hypothetical protein